MARSVVVLIILKTLLVSKKSRFCHAGPGPVISDLIRGRDNGSGIQIMLAPLDSGYRMVSGTGFAGMTENRKN
jgi:hypothetical protein